jgi:hypothetical protein
VPKVHLEEAFPNIKLRDMLYDANISDATLFSEAANINTSTNPRFHTPAYNYGDIIITKDVTQRHVTFSADPESLLYEGVVSFG